MTVYQISKVRVKPGRLNDFLEHQEEVKAINERYGLKSRRLLRASLAGEEVGTILIVSEFEDEVAHATWTTERSKDADYQVWRTTTPNANPDSPATLLSTMLFKDITE